MQSCDYVIAWKYYYVIALVRNDDVIVALGSIEIAFWNSISSTVTVTIYFSVCNLSF